MSRAVLDDHRRVWNAKPVLADVYRVWFDLLCESLPPGGHILEVGAGPGFLRAHIRERRPDLRFVASDLIHVPWNDLAADCLHLPLPAGALDAVVGLDALHHFGRPRRFFEEARRALKPDGRLVFIEPWVTPFSYPIYRFLHREGCRLGLDPWDPFSLDRTGSKAAFDGDAAVLWRLVRTTRREEWNRLGFEGPQCQPLNAFAYLLSLGFQPPSLLPRGAFPPLLTADRALRGLAAGLGMRALAVWTALPAITPTPVTASAP